MIILYVESHPTTPLCEPDFHGDESLKLVNCDYLGELLWTKLSGFHLHENVYHAVLKKTISDLKTRSVPIYLQYSVHM